MSESFYDPEQNYRGAGRSPIPGDTSFDDWMAFGIFKGWCGPPVCYTHDGFPMTEEEIQEFETGDPCVHMIRLYIDDEHKKAVEDAHSPSQWRNNYTK